MITPNESVLRYAAEFLNKYDELETALAHPDHPDYLENLRIYGEATEQLSVIKEYNEAVKTLGEAAELLKSDDEEMRQLAAEELENLSGRIPSLEKTIRHYMTPVDERDLRSVIMEIRAGAGGEEAALFAGDLYRMYMGYAQLKGFEVTPVDSSETELGGYKEIIFAVKGDGIRRQDPYFHLYRGSSPGSDSQGCGDLTERPQDRQIQGVRSGRPARQQNRLRDKDNAHPNGTRSPVSG